MAQSIQWGPVERSQFTYHTFLIVLGFNDTSTIVGHFVSSPREKEKLDRKDRRDKEEPGRKRNKNECEETEEINQISLYLYLLKG